MAKVEFFFDCSSPWTYLAIAEIGGLLNLRTSIELQPGKPAQVRTALSDIRDLRFRAYGSTIDVPRVRGEITVDAQPTSAWRVEAEVRAQLRDRPDAAVLVIADRGAGDDQRRGVAQPTSQGHHGA